MSDLSGIPFELRGANLKGAVAHLKRHCILVDVVDRKAQIRRFWVSGVDRELLAEGVIRQAVMRGFEVIRG